MKWVKGQFKNEWVLSGTEFVIYRDASDGRWDISECEGYLCTARYVDVAKNICERLSGSPRKTERQR